MEWNKEDHFTISWFTANGKSYEIGSANDGSGEYWFPETGKSILKATFAFMATAFR